MTCQALGERAICLLDTDLYLSQRACTSPPAGKEGEQQARETGLRQACNVEENTAGH